MKKREKKKDEGKEREEGRGVLGNRKDSQTYLTRYLNFVVKKEKTYRPELGSVHGKLVGEERRKKKNWRALAGTILRRLCQNLLIKVRSHSKKEGREKKRTETLSNRGAKKPWR